MVFRYIFVSILGYIFGNITTSYFVSKRAANIDIRNHGSGNAGATNVFRVLGVKAAAVTFIGDGLKGVLVVIIGGMIAGVNGQYLAGAFVVIGHNWPVVLGFKGGKGIASTIGVMAIIDPMLLLPVLASAIAVLLITKYVSLASVLGITVFPLILIITGQSAEYILFSIVLWAMAIYRHRENISRLLKGTESKLGKKKRS